MLKYLVSFLALFSVGIHGQSTTTTYPIILRGQRCDCACANNGNTQPRPTAIPTTMPVTRPSPSPKQASPVTPSPVPSSPVASGSVPAKYAEILKIHNDKRAWHHASPLQWDANVAATAQKWADGCVFRHSGGQGLGENLYSSSGGTEADALRNAATMWYDEINMYNFDAPGFSMQTGHASAVLWASTTKLGCGVKTCPGMIIVVCNYFSAGNVIGRFEANVLRH